VDHIQHLALPLRLTAAGHYAAVEQGSLDELRVCAMAVVRYPLGFRDDRPEYGVPDPELRQQPIDTAAIVAALGRWEPRAAVTVAQAPVDPADDGAAHLTISVDFADGDGAYQEEIA